MFSLFGKIINSQALCTRLGPCENINNILGPEATFYFEDKLKAENSSRNWRKLSLGHFHGNIMDVASPHSHWEEGGDFLTSPAGTM